MASSSAEIKRGKRERGENASYESDADTEQLIVMCVSDEDGIIKWPSPCFTVEDESCCCCCCCCYLLACDSRET